MGLLDSLVQTALQSALGGSSQNQTANVVKSVVGMLTSNSGGISGLVDTLSKSGLADVAASWIGKGDNKPISATQLVEALGQDKVDELAQEAGIPPEKGAEVLSQVLPGVVNEMTPDGEIPEEQHMGTLAKVILGGLGVAGAAMAAKAVAGHFGSKEEAEAAVAQASSDSPQSAPAAAPSAAPAAQTYTVVSGDNLSKIAKHFYGNANDWHKIFDANRDQISNPDLIKPGQVLRIP
jgi:uncharacterized protein YidB (DUF937 family)